MAGGGEEEVSEWQKIKEEMTCSICGDLFTTPKTIPCLHTFCKVCLEKSIEMNKKFSSDICCPLCRAKLPLDDVDLIPTNFTTKHVIEIYVQRKKSISDTCVQSVPTVPAVQFTMASSDEPSIQGHPVELQKSEDEPKSNKLYVAMYGYLPRKENELAFKEGDMFYVSNTDDPNWWYAEHVESSYEGYIPTNYVKKFEEKQSLVSAVPETQNKEEVTEKWKSTMALNPSNCVFVAKYNYAPRRDNELGFKKGDLLYIVNGDDTNWWLGKIKNSPGPIGYIPVNYVANFENQDDGAVFPSETVNINYPLYVGMYNYSPKQDSDLGFKKGQLLCIIKYLNPNWWLAGKIGYIPSSYVSEFRTEALNNDKTAKKLELVERSNLRYPLFLAKFSYIPIKDSELGFVEGDLLYIVNGDDRHWWLAGQVGYIPSNYVSEFRADQDDSAIYEQVNKEEDLFQVMSKKHNVNSIGLKKSASEQSLKSTSTKILKKSASTNSTNKDSTGLSKGYENQIGLALCNNTYPVFIGKYSYSARTNVDLSFKKGDLLCIIRNDDDGWWLAQTKDSSQQGYIPSSYVKEYKSPLDAEE